jgi:UDP-GlcNAc3NAcA epimerase
VQKEAYWFNVPCITLREEIEWVELVQIGCNQVVGADSSRILDAVNKAEENARMNSVGKPTELYGDGHSALKVVNILRDTIGL